MKNSNKINILYLETGKAGGGAFQSLFFEVDNIDKNRFSPVVVFLNHNRFVEKYREIGVPCFIIKDHLFSLDANPFVKLIYRLPGMLVNHLLPILSIPYKSWVHRRTIRELNRLVEEYRIDILHLSSQIDKNFFALFTAKKYSLPCFSHLRNFTSWKGNRHKADFANLHVTSYLAVSSAIRDHWVAEGLDSSKTMVIHNGKPVPQIHPFGIREKWNIREDETVVGCAGRLMEWKGQGFLIRSFRKVMDVNKNVKLVIVGDGPLGGQLRELARELRMENHVIFTGFQRRAVDIISELDILVLSSRKEPCGGVLIEALQTKTPVIGTDCGGTPELIKNSEWGLLVPYGDSEKMSKAILTLIDNREMRTRFAEAGFDFFCRELTIGTYIRKIEKIYTDAVASKT